MQELQARQKNDAIERAVNDALGTNIPEPLQKGIKAVLFRQICSPNFEFRYFMRLTELFKLEPMLFEFVEDKFLGINQVKRFLGKLRMQQSISSEKIVLNTILDFNSNNGKKIRDVNTYWTQSLTDFHHELLELFAPGTNQFLYDASEWFKHEGGNARNYYIKYLFLFMKHGVLFENFSFCKSELKFVKEIFLPAFISIWRKTGLKPLICELLPSDTQDDNFWLSYPFEIKGCIKRKMPV